MIFDIEGNYEALWLVDNSNTACFTAGRLSYTVGVSETHVRCETGLHPTSLTIFRMKKGQIAGVHLPYRENNTYSRRVVLGNTVRTTMEKLVALLIVGFE